MNLIIEQPQKSEAELLQDLIKEMKDIRDGYEVVKADVKEIKFWVMGPQMEMDDEAE